MSGCHKEISNVRDCQRMMRRLHIPAVRAFQYGLSYIFSAPTDTYADGVCEVSKTSDLLYGYSHTITHGTTTVNPLRAVYLYKHKHATTPRTFQTVRLLKCARPPTLLPEFNTQAGKNRAAASLIRSIVNTLAL